jgi:hypothetical protein
VQTEKRSEHVQVCQRTVLHHSGRFSGNPAVPPGIPLM